MSAPGIFMVGDSSVGLNSGFIGTRSLAVWYEEPPTGSFLLILKRTRALVGMPLDGLSVATIFPYSSVPT